NDEALVGGEAVEVEDRTEDPGDEADRTLVARRRLAEAFGDLRRADDPEAEVAAGEQPQRAGGALDDDQAARRFVRRFFRRFFLHNAEQPGEVHDADQLAADLGDAGQPARQVRQAG